jgi:hypothetical protein
VCRLHGTSETILKFNATGLKSNSLMLRAPDAQTCLLHMSADPYSFVMVPVGGSDPTRRPVVCSELSLNPTIAYSGKQRPVLSTATCTSHKYPNSTQNQALTSQEYSMPRLSHAILTPMCDAQKLCCECPWAKLCALPSRARLLSSLHHSGITLQAMHGKSRHQLRWLATAAGSDCTGFTCDAIMLVLASTFTLQTDTYTYHTGAARLACWDSGEGDYTICGVQVG